jgi:hypothetical protein
MKEAHVRMCVHARAHTHTHLAPTEMEELNGRDGLVARRRDLSTTP